MAARCLRLVCTAACSVPLCACSSYCLARDSRDASATGPCMHVSMHACMRQNHIHFLRKNGRLPALTSSRSRCAERPHHLTPTHSCIHAHMQHTCLRCAAVLFCAAACLRARSWSRMRWRTPRILLLSFSSLHFLSSERSVHGLSGGRRVGEEVHTCFEGGRVLAAYVGNKGIIVCKVCFMV